MKCRFRSETGEQELVNLGRVLQSSGNLCVGGDRMHANAIAILHLSRHVLSLDIISTTHASDPNVDM